MTFEKTPYYGNYDGIWLTSLDLFLIIVFYTNPEMAKGWIRAMASIPIGVYNVTCKGGSIDA